MSREHRFEPTDLDKSAMDYHEHHKTYGLFKGLTKWVIIAAILILALMALTLT
jgi:hypothetical protein